MPRISHTAVRLVDRAAAQVVRQLCRARIEDLAALRNANDTELGAFGPIGFPNSIAIHAGAHGGVKYVRASLGHQDWALEWHNVRGLFEAVIASDLNQAMADVRFLILARVVNEIQEADYERRLAAEAA